MPRRYKREGVVRDRNAGMGPTNAGYSAEELR